MKSAGKLIVNPALRHAIERRAHHLQRLLVAAPATVVNEQIEYRWMGKFWS